MSESFLEMLGIDECRALLRAHTVGRIAVVVNENPIVLPVNYRMVETDGITWIAIRTRPGNVLDRSGSTVAFELDGIDLVHREGWSVLVRGTLHAVDPDAADFQARFGPDPWFATDRDRWLVIQPFDISGRRLRTEDEEWAFQPRSYL